jgi:hypothetical protein
LIFSILVVAIVGSAPDHIFTQAPSPVTKINGAAKTDITVQALRGNISLLMGSGGNIAVFTSPEGKLLVDVNSGAIIGRRWHTSSSFGINH